MIESRRWKNFFCVLLLIVFLSGPFNVFADQVGEILTLKQAVALAVKHNQDLKVAENRVENQKINLDQSKWDYYPDLSAKAGAGVGRNTRAVPDDNMYRSLSAAISSTLNLFNGFENQANHYKSRYELESEKDLYTRTRQTVIYNTVTAYLDAVLKKEHIRVAEENLKDNEKQLEQIDAFYKAGRRPVTDLYQQQAEAANARLNLLSAKENWNTSRMALLEVIGISAFSSVDVSGVESVLNGIWVFSDTSVLAADALEKRPDVKSKKNELMAADQAVKEARSGHYPSVDLVLELSSSYSSLDNGGVQSQMGDDKLNASAGINVSIPIFDRNITKNKVSKAQIASRTVKVELEKLERQIEVELGEAMANFQTASEQVDVSRSRQAFSEKALESTRERYKAGAATLTELTTAQSSFVAAQYDLVDAELKKVIKAMALSFYRGDMAEITGMVEK